MRSLWVFCNTIHNSFLALFGIIKHMYILVAATAENLVEGRVPDDGNDGFWANVDSLNFG